MLDEQPTHHIITKHQLEHIRSLEAKLDDARKEIEALTETMKATKAQAQEKADQGKWAEYCFYTGMVEGFDAAITALRALLAK